MPAFDPATDSPVNGAQVTVVEFYDELCAAGFDEEAAEIREIPDPVRQRNTAVALKKELLLEAGQSDEERRYTRSLTVDPKKRMAETKAFVEQKMKMKEEKYGE